MLGYGLQERPRGTLGDARMIKRTVRAGIGLFIAVCALGSCTSQQTEATGSCPRIEYGIFSSQASNSTRPVRHPQGRTIFLETTPLFRLQDIAQAHLGSDGATVLMSVKADAAERLIHATTNNSGVRLAFVVDDEALMAVVWEGDYGFESGDLQLSFRSADMAQRLVSTIERCKGAAK